MPSENGWEPARANGATQCEWVRVPGAEHVSLQILKGQPLTILRAFAADYHAHVEPLRDADSACWTPTNSVPTSNHLNGTGMDLNWQGPDGNTFRLGITKERAFPGGQSRAVDELLDFYEGIIFNGGKWSIRDWMHWQLNSNTYNNPRTQDFINRKIRADGFSTFRRGGTTPPPPAQPQLSKADQYALAIIAEGRRRGITPRGIQIAFSVVFVESNWKMYANLKVPESLRLPHDAVGSDYDSVGLFQQRCPMWGPAWVLMDPARSAGLFYDRLVKMDYNNPARSPGSYAADIQRPAAQYRYRYDERFVDAVMLYQRLAGVTPPPISGEDDFLSALTPDEQRALFNAIMTPRRSRSPLRHLNEGTVGDTPDQVWDMDGSIHILVVYLLAKLKYPDPDAMALLREVADMDVAVNPGRERDRKLARAILADLDEQTAQPAAARVPAVYVAPEPEVLPAVHEPTPAQPQQQGTVNTPEALLNELDRLKTFDQEYRKRFDRLTVKDDDDSTGSHSL